MGNKRKNEVNLLDDVERPEAIVPKTKPSIVSKEPVIVSKLLMRSQWTPDFQDLRFHSRIPLFVYDDVMREGAYHKLLDGAEYLGRAHTLGGYYRMKDNGNNPIVFREETSDVGRGHIRGEAYSVNIEMLHLVDREMENGVKSDRFFQKIMLEDQKPGNALSAFRNIPWIHCFMYLGKTAYWDKMGGLRFRSIRRSNTEKFPLGARPYFEWDSWENGWEEEVGGRPFTGPFPVGHGVHTERWYQDAYGGWHKHEDGYVHIG